MILRVAILDEDNKCLDVHTMSDQDIVISRNSGETSMSITPKLRQALTEKIVAAFGYAAEGEKPIAKPKSNVIPFRKLLVNNHPDTVT